MNERLMKRAASLHTLAHDPGATPHERMVAQQKLDAMIAKYGEAITNYDKPIMAWFKYSSRFERSLLIQLVGVILDSGDAVTSFSPKGTGRRTKIGFELTRQQAKDLQNAYELYKTLWAEELDVAITAFFYRHHLFPASLKAMSVDFGSPEWEKAMRAEKLAKGMQESENPFHKQLEEGE